ncbi:MAG: low-specificity L-threonine aldolase [Saccharospirillum sp.]|uniref:low-specificity L-threonine aldolase n=1 Tax=Saccharospirillum sp. TaxID=2033801 RepID=UPI0034A05B28
MTMTEHGPLVDLRSDTVTRPTEAMRAAMARAEVGDDVFGDDPSINRLEARMADLTGKAAAVLLPTGTQSNLVALLSHCQRGDEYLVGQNYHTYFYEAGGAAVLGSIQPQPMPVQADGTLALDTLAQMIKPDDCHFARSRLIALENTHGGRVMPREFIGRVRQLADQYGLSVHLDGARLFNAAIASGQTVADLAQAADSVSICCSKGLGAPMGSVLVGSAELIKQARRWRKMVGGGMRQAGIIAAAIDHALDHHVDRLADDHANAERLHAELSVLPGIVEATVNTNMVYIELESREKGLALQAALRERGILTAGGQKIRLVTHLDITTDMIDRVVTTVADVLS